MFLPALEAGMNRSTEGILLMPFLFKELLHNMSGNTRGSMMTIVVKLRMRNHVVRHPAYLSYLVMWHFRTSGPQTGAQPVS